MSIPCGDGIALARELVRIDSRNPSLVPGASGEAEIANVLASVMRDWGFAVELIEAAPGRPSVVARRQGTGGGRSLMLNGHIDVVGTDGMSHPAFEAVERDGRLYARGASDMKGGVAAMCAAAANAGAVRGDIIVAAVCDEEWQSVGTASVIAAGVRADAAIVTEPTGLRIMPAHRGFAWLEVRVHGRAAHGSRWDLGVDAIRETGYLLTELDRLDTELLPRREHPLLGRPSLHASVIEGGTGLSTYPDRCTLRIERRTIPGETLAEVLGEIRDACARVHAARPRFRADVEVLFAQPPSDVPADAPIVGALECELRERRMDATATGMSAWTDAALLNDAGIPAICFGPGDMGLAHAAEEYIEIDEIARATEILTALTRRWCA